MTALEVKNLNISFNENKILNDLCFSVNEHRVFGFLGKNGAGKTTTMKIVLGLLKSDSGSVKVFGNDVKFGETQTNKDIGYLPDVPEFYGFMNSCEYLELCGNITKMQKSLIKERTEKYLKMVGLFDVKGKRISSFSRGMKQRLGIAQALLNEPKLLICDEPTSALDPIGRKEILDILHQIKNQTTVIFSTHILSDVESICDDIAILNNGQIELFGNLEEIKRTNSKRKLEILFENELDKKRFLSTYNNDIENKSVQNKLDFVININDDKETEMFFNILSNNNIVPKKFEIYEPSLENIFLEVVK